MCLRRKTTNDSLQRYSIGIDIEGASVNFGIVDFRGIILHRGIQLDACQYISFQTLVDDLAHRLIPFIEILGKEHFKGIGVSLYSTSISGCRINLEPNSFLLPLPSLEEIIVEKFELPCVINSEVHAAAIGQMMFGIGAEIRNFTVVTLGERAASIVVSNGNINSKLGEIIPFGHVVANLGKRQWKNGLRGCLDSYVSAKGILTTAKIILERSKKPSTLRKLESGKLEPNLIYQCAKEGDELAQYVHRFTGQKLGQALAFLIIVTLQSNIILLGRTVKVDELMLETAKNFMDKNLPDSLRKKINLILDETGGKQGGVLFASALVW